MRRDRKRITQIVKSTLAIALTFVVLVTSGTFSYAGDGDGSGARAEGGTDKTAKLTNLIASINHNEGGSLPYDDLLDISIRFGVPVLGDGIAEADCVKKWDTASFQLAKGFVFDGELNKPYSLSTGSIEVGHLSISSDDQKVLTANITFDGADEVFDGIDHGEGIWSEVNCAFSCKLKYDQSGDFGTEGDHDVYVLDQKYTVNVPHIPVTISGNKSGTREGDYINWVVQIDAKKGTTQDKLDGYTFVDNITAVGEYAADSFKIGTENKISTAVSAVPDSDELTNNKILKYTFPEGTSGTQYVFFSTKIPEDKLMAAESSVANTAEVYKGDNLEKQFPTTVNFTTEWIEKELAASSNEEGTISWTITANQSGVSLPEAVITDKLDEKLNFVSATWSKQKTDGSGWETGQNITPDTEGNYALGNINTPVQLTICAKLKDDKDYKHTIQHIENSASISWKDHVGIVSGTVKTDIGMNPIKKTAAGYEVKTAQVKWKVKIDKSDVASDLRTLDLLIYGSQPLVNTKTYTIDGSEGSGLQSISGEVLKALQPSYNQSYVANSFEAGEGCNLTFRKYTVKDGETPVADLLVVTGADENTGINPTAEKAQEYTCKTQVTDPALYMGNAQVTDPALYMGNAQINVSNWVELYSGDARVNNSKAEQICKPHKLQKDVISRDGAKTIASLVANASDEEILDAAAGASVGTADTGFDYKDKSAVFKLSINSDGTVVGTDGISGAGGHLLKDFKISDVLPEGWEFVDILGDSKYLVFGGTGHEGSVTPTSYIENTSDLLTASITAAAESQGQKINFAFKKMDGPYAIYVKARPTDAALANYFVTNDTASPENTATITCSRSDWKPEVKKSVKVVSKLLSKSREHTEDGVLKWTVDYCPYDIAHDLASTNVTDTLPEGIELRLKKDGTLAVTDGEKDNITIHKLVLKPDGTYELGSAITPAAGENVFYNPSTRALEFKLEDTKEAYRFTYITDITASEGKNLTNNVSLATSNSSGTHVDASYTSNNLDASATMRRSGYIEITKINNQGTVLDGAQFTLFGTKTDGDKMVINEEQVIRVGVTADGKLRLLGLPEGIYILKETHAPSGYVLSKTEHIVEIVKDDGRIITTIDGNGNGNSGAAITIESRTEGFVGVQKYAADSETALSGAQLEIRQGDDTSAVTDQDGKTAKWESDGKIWDFKLANGTYKLVETKAPDGYAIASPITFVMEDGIVKIDGTEVADNVIEMKDDVFTAALAFTMHDMDEKGTIGKELSGAEFVLKKNGTVYQRVTSDSDGKISFTITEKGTYTIEETQIPAGYQAITLGSPTFVVKDDDFKQLLTIEAGVVTRSEDKTAAKVGAGRIAGTVTLKKIDGATWKELNGVEFTLYKKTSGNLFENLFHFITGNQYQKVTEREWDAKVDAEGMLTIKNIPWGDYYLQETKPADGYKTDDAKYNFSIGQLQTELILAVDLGVIKNTQTSVTFHTAGLQTETCGANAMETQNMEGVTFQAFSDRGLTSLAATSISDENGDVTFHKLNSGTTYYIKETAIPEKYAAQYYKVNEKIFVVTIDEDGELTGLTTLDGISVSGNTIINDVYRATISFVKVDEKKPEITIENSTYGLYKLQPERKARFFSFITGQQEDSFVYNGNTYVKIAEATTDREGMISFEGVLLGTEYLVRELVAPNGCYVSEKPMVIKFKRAAAANAEAEVDSIEMGDGTVSMDASTGEIIWYEPQVEVSISKTDEFGALLAGASLEIRDKNNNVMESWVSTDQEPYTSYGVLNNGETYTLIETKAPDGYEIAEPITFTITSDSIGPKQNIIQELTMVDKKAVIMDSEGTKMDDSSSNNTSIKGTDTSDSFSMAGWFILLAAGSITVLLAIKRKIS